MKRRGSRAQLAELEQLEKQAEQGRRYLGALRSEVKRLLLTAEKNAGEELAEKLTEGLEEDELKALERIYRAKAAERLGLRTQLSYGERQRPVEDESDFRV